MQDQSYSKAPQRTTLMAAALEIASRGIPVFPCKQGGKRPLTEHGHLDATTDPRKIHAWWNRWARANIGVPTGRRSGLLVIDIDPGKGGEESLVSLEATYGPIPETTVVRSGRGGRHFYLRYPEDAEVRNSSGRLGPGIDVRGEGGYVLAPPSFTKGPYSTREKRPWATLPPRLLSRLREGEKKELASASGQGQARPVSIDVAGPPITEGSRNDELVRIAGKLHDGTRTLEELIDDLTDINKARCVPAESAAKIERLARWAHNLEPCAASFAGGRSRDPEAKLEELIRALDAAWFADPAKGVGGRTASSIERVLLRVGQEFGTVVPGVGLRVEISIRRLAEEAACHYNTVLNVTMRLRAAGVLRKDDQLRKGTESGAFVLLDPRLGCDTQPTASLPPGAAVDGVSQVGRALCCKASVGELRTAHYRWRGQVGKGRERALCLLEAQGPQTAEELAARLGWSRARDLRARYLEPLVELGLVEDRGGLWALADAHEQRAAEARREPYSTVQLRLRRSRSVEGRTVTEVATSGTVASEEERLRLDREQHQRQREAFRAQLALRGTDADEACRELLNRWDEETSADGYIIELRPVDPMLIPGDDGVIHHGPECSCSWCEDTPTPRYARRREAG